MTLKDLAIGQSALIEEVGGQGALRQHFLDMGVIPGAQVTMVKFAPMGDPLEVMIHGYELTLRLDDAKQITIGEPYTATNIKETTTFKGNRVHPGLGEEGKYHKKNGEDPYPDGTLLRFALVGNPNSGKTTLFNQLTGSNQHVGNFPGVTVDRKSGPIRGIDNTELTDLPGIYSLSPFTEEEKVSRDYVLKEKPNGIINIVDANNIERNLSLTLQLLELDIPMVLALNFMDEFRSNGGAVDLNILEEMLGIPVVPISAAKGEGVDELIHHALHVTKYKESPGRRDFCTAEARGGALHRCIHSVTHMIEDHAIAHGVNGRFAATKLVEGDTSIADFLELSENERETIEHLVLTMEEESGIDRAAGVAEMRFDYIVRLVKMTVTKATESREHQRSQQIDRILTGKYTALPCFILIMSLVFYLTFHLVGPFLQGLLEKGIGGLTLSVDAVLRGAGVDLPVQSLIIDGIFRGVGSVVSFVPVVVVLFFFLSILEDSGYIARVAFFMDKLLRKLGLSGRSMIPLLIGFGCTVPGVMACRTMPSARDRKLTILLTPFMSCTAKLPIYGFFGSLFFPQYAGMVTVALYLLGIFMAILVALVSKNVMFRGEAVPFVMELPNYRLPSARNVALLLWEKARDFLERAFTLILVGTVVIWLLQNFDVRLHYVPNGEGSILSVFAGFVAPVFRLHGFADWRIVTSLVAGFLAKESVVSTLMVLFGSEELLRAALSGAGAASLLVFCLLYTPCVAAIASIRRELGGKWAISLLIFQCIIAWVVSLLVAVIGNAL